MYVRMFRKTPSRLILQRRFMGKVGEDAKKFAESAKKSESKSGSEKTGKESKSESFASFADKSRKIWHNPIMKDVYGALKETKQTLIDNNASRYGGLTSKAFREEIKKQRLKGFKSAEEMAAEVAENPDAGSGVVVHKDSKWKESWNSFKESNPLIQGIFTMRRKVEESDNPLVNTARFITDRLRYIFGDAFEENEHAQTIAEIKMVDPNFDLEEFMQDARELMVPEVLEAFVYWDPKTLKEWCSDGVFSVLNASREPLVAEGLDIEGKILDLRNVELVMAKIMDGVPLLIMSFKTQQIETIRNMKGEIVGGSPEAINDVYYIWALTKDAEKPNPLTKGWKIVEFAIQGVRESY